MDALQTRPPRHRGAVLAATALLAALSLAGPATAHRAGKAEPRISAGVTHDPGLHQTLTVRLTDIDSGDPIRGARVTAHAEAADGMETAPVRLREVRPARYRATIEFPEAGSWTVHIDVAGGKKISKASAKLPTIVEAAPAGGEATTTEEHGAGAAMEEEPPIQVLSTRLEDKLEGRDYARMASLWVHSLAAMGWIIGVLVLALGLSTRPGILAETARERLGRWYVSWGAWLHWGLVPVIIGTGVYNMFYVTPFDLIYNPGRIDELREIPYGLLYEGILLVKLTFFAVLLVTGTRTLLRTLHLELPVVPVSNPHPGFVGVLASALGPAGLIYLATVPLILGAAMALRYVHVLNHVAEVVSHG